MYELIWSNSCLILSMSKVLSVSMLVVVKPLFLYIDFEVIFPLSVLWGTLVWIILWAGMTVYSQKRSWHRAVGWDMLSWWDVTVGLTLDTRMCSAILTWHKHHCSLYLWGQNTCVQLVYCFWVKILFPLCRLRWLFL